MNNIEDMQKSFEGQKFKVFSPFKCDISKNEDGNYVDDTTIFAFAWFCRGIASQAQQTESQKHVAWVSKADLATLHEGHCVNVIPHNDDCVFDQSLRNVALYALPPAPE